MKTRIFTNWRTSILGILLLFLMSLLLYLRSITAGEFTAFFPTILALLYVRDTVLQINP